MGFIIGLPTLRLRGDYLAIATLGFGEIIRLSILNIEYLGGATGIPQIPQYATLMSVSVVTAAHGAGDQQHHPEHAWARHDGGQGG